MNRIIIGIAALLAGIALNSQSAETVFQEFIKTKGDQLLEGEKPFRFISFNVPNLHLVEDNVAFSVENPWRLPDRFEIVDAFATIRVMGGTVIRPYVISVLRTNDEPAVPRHVLGPGKFNEDAFRTLDEVLEVANEAGVRLILPLVDCWSWWGGAAEYAGFRGKPKEAFWTDPEVIRDFQQTIRYVLNRTNTMTGMAYRDDKAILCWETGNELTSPPEWTRQIARFIKSIDTNHLVMDGFQTTELRPESLTMPEIDIVTTHHYPGGKKTYAELIRENSEKAQGKKPYVVGEFGFEEVTSIAKTLDAVMESGTSGALLWSLRPRNRDGGFYWHSEPAGGNKYKAYHCPGFASGAAYEEVHVLNLLRRKAYEIRGLRLPAPPAPLRPLLLPVHDEGGLSWQGSVAATSYIVERSPTPEGPWTLAARDVDESAVQYRPLFLDTKALPGNWFYRVRARNESGVSEPSNVVGPYELKYSLFLDELSDFSLINRRAGKLELQTQDCRKAKEDAHRVRGYSGSSITYKLPGTVRTCRIYSFFPGEIFDFRFLVSSQNQTPEKLTPQKTVCFHGAGEYDYWKPVMYQCESSATNANFLTIEFANEAQIGRVEITYGGE